MEFSKSVEAVVSRVGELPAMPKVVAEVIRLTENPSTAMAEISEIIQRDPALAAKILQVSNSPYYGLRGQVGTLKLALVILGVREVRNIVLAVSIFDTFHNADTEALMTSNFWSHSISVAGMSKMLAHHIRVGMQGEEFMAGLLHDIGKMILWHQLGKEYARIFNQAAKSGEDLVIAEKTAFGFDHTDVGAALIERWDLPPALGDAIWLHHFHIGGEPLRKAENPVLAAVVRVANQAFHDNLAQREDGECKAADDDEAWSILASVSLPIDRPSRREILTQFALELQNMSAPVFSAPGEK